jgi:hypothetical protein
MNPCRLIFSLLFLSANTILMKSAAYYFLCTGASLYASYSLLLIYNKFWMGGGGWGVGGGDARGPSRRGRIKGVGVGVGVGWGAKQGD